MKIKVLTCLALGALLTTAVMSCRKDSGNRDTEFLERFQPQKPFSETEVPPAPVYSNPAHWGCLPDRDGDPCDEVPENTDLKDRQADAKADCFAVYPTTFYRRYGWNARLDDRITKRITDRGPLRTQFSVYNGSCRIFAPYFRQAQIGVFSLPPDDTDLAAAKRIASQDVLSAFQYYLDHYDKGYPIIITGHSQGIRYAINILREHFDGKPLKERLVAGYLIGGNLIDGSFEHLPVCDSPTETGCVLGWRTAEWGYSTNIPADTPGDIKDIRVVCVNPLSWRHDEEWVDADENLGGVPSRFNRVDSQVTGARCSGNSLWVKPVITRGYHSLRGNYHLCDYALFYMNIRANVMERIEAFYEKQ